ncbi:hypothetical protein [Synechococcus sp. CS-1328]|uniref:hypothetical protein n=1 Tax=Synechococcus sp. CS-1328 TaxID=2847976 RepID=UPI00223B33B2|nr:hypothetical protein [Synechococcus sp. CS-1328]
MMPRHGVAFVAHMGGETMEIRLQELFPSHSSGCKLLLASPGLELTAVDLAGDSIALSDSQALLLEPLAR